MVVLPELAQEPTKVMAFRSGSSKEILQTAKDPGNHVEQTAASVKPIPKRNQVVNRRARRAGQTFVVYVTSSSKIEMQKTCKRCISLRTGLCTTDQQLEKRGGERSLCEYSCAEANGQPDALSAGTQGLEQTKHLIQRIKQ
jgi:hypothetical protein